MLDHIPLGREKAQPDTARSATYQQIATVPLAPTRASVDRSISTYCRGHSRGYASGSLWTETRNSELRLECFTISGHLRQRQTIRPVKFSPLFSVPLVALSTALVLGFVSFMFTILAQGATFKLVVGRAPTIGTVIHFEGSSSQMGGFFASGALLSGPGPMKRRGKPFITDRPSLVKAQRTGSANRDAVP
jgi:hypothetical protein